MNPSLHERLRDDARESRERVPAGMLDRVRAGLADRPSPRAAHPRATWRPFVAAASLAAALVATIWIVNASRTAPTESARLARSEARDAPARDLPARGVALATLVSAPLALEWERLKLDSEALLREIGRDIPLRRPRD